MQFETDEDLVKTVTAKDFENYFYSMEEKYKKSTINFKIEVAKEFLNFCVKANIIEKNPTQTVEMYSGEEVKMMLKKNIYQAETKL